MNVKNLITGVVIGAFLIMLLGANTAKPTYESQLSFVSERRCIYAVLNTNTGETKMFEISSGPGHLVVQKATLSISGDGDWSN